MVHGLHTYCRAGHVEKKRDEKRGEEKEKKKKDDMIRGEDNECLVANVSEHVVVVIAM